MKDIYNKYLENEISENEFYEIEDTIRKMQEIIRSEMEEKGYMELSDKKYHKISEKVKDLYYKNPHLNDSEIPAILIESAIEVLEGEYFKHEIDNREIYYKDHEALKSFIIFEY